MGGSLQDFSVSSGGSLRILPDLLTKTVEFSFYEKLFWVSKTFLGILSINGSVKKHKKYGMFYQGGTLLEGSTGNLVSHTDYGVSNYTDDIHSNWEIR